MMMAIMAVVAGVLETVVPVHLVITAVVVGAWLFEGKRVIVAAFLLGLLVDVSYVRVLGLSSVWLVLLVAGIRALRLQFEWHSFVAVFVSAGLGELMMRWWLGEVSSGWAILGQGVVAVLVWLLNLKLMSREGVYVRKG